jgi:hypothetical protein
MTMLFSLPLLGERPFFSSQQIIADCSGDPGDYHCDTYNERYDRYYRKINMRHATALRPGDGVGHQDVSFPSV